MQKGTAIKVPPSTSPTRKAGSLPSAHAKQALQIKATQSRLSTATVLVRQSANRVILPVRMNGITDATHSEASESKLLHKDYGTCLL